MNISRALTVLLLTGLSVSFTSSPACADSWILPTTTTYLSCGGHTRITISPRKLESQIRYFEEQAARAGQVEGGLGNATARLERLSDKRWKVVWERGIANDVAPVAAIVRDDGKYAVTFDDWHGVGYGPNAVVIYDADGELVRALALSDIVPADYIKALPHSVSSIHWRADPRFSPDGRQVLIPIVIPSQDFQSVPATTDVAVDLADGRVSPTDPIAWKGALGTAREVRASQSAAEAANTAAFLAPLLGPRINAEQEWHGYLREAVYRLIGDNDTPSTTVLRAPGMKDYALSEKWVRDALTDDIADKVGLASLSEPDLVSALDKVTAKLPRQSLSKITVFIALSDRYWPEAVAAMRHTGAKLVQLNPATPIPQRAERIVQRDGGT